MFQDAATVEAKYQRFVKRACAEQQVWGLHKPEGWATSESNDYDDTELWPFWSARAYAVACCKGDWAGYVPVAIPLTEFLENWCVGLHQDNTLIATDMDANMFGREVEPLELALQLVKECEQQGQQLSFRKYSAAEEFTASIRANLND